MSEFIIIHKHHISNQVLHSGPCPSHQRHMERYKEMKESGSIEISFQGNEMSIPPDPQMNEHIFGMFITSGSSLIQL